MKRSKHLGAKVGLEVVVHNLGDHEPTCFSNLELTIACRRRNEFNIIVDCEMEERGLKLTMLKGII